MRPSRPLLAAAVGLLLGSLALPATAAPAPRAEQRYLVQYAAGSATETVQALRAYGGADAVLPSVRTASATLTAAEADALRTDDDVVRVEPDRRARVASLVQPGAPWGLDRIDQRGAALDGSYSFDSDGRDVALYVIDTGIRSDHVDLAGRVVPGFSNVHDGRGTEDCHGHGTHVAGIAGGSTHGVAKKVTLVAVRPLECDGTGWYSDILASIDWVVGNHLPGVPAVANLSLEGEASAALDAGVQALVDDGIAVTVAGGNAGVDACTSSPGRTPAAITVGATMQGDRRASFSNTGPCLDLFAPGHLVVSSDNLSRTDTWSRSGTSMAAPHVAGAAALLLQRDRGLSPAAVSAALTSSATTGVVTHGGPGSPDRLLHTGPVAAAPLQAPVAAAPATDPPSAPTRVVGRRGARAITVSWQAALDGGSPLTGSLVSVRSGGQAVRTVAAPAGATSVTVPGLYPHVDYTFTVTSRNAHGAGPASLPSRAVRPGA